MTISTSSRKLRSGEQAKKATCDATTLVRRLRPTPGRTASGADQHSERSSARSSPMIDQARVGGENAGTGRMSATAILFSERDQ